MDEGQDIVGGPDDVMAADGPAEKPVYTDPTQARGRRKQRGGEGEIARHLRGDNPTFSGYFDAPSKEVECLRCDAVFTSKSRENRLCTTCRGGTEALVVGSIREGAIASGAGGGTPSGGMSPRTQGTGPKVRRRMGTDYRRRG